MKYHSDQIKSQIANLKAEITEWPRDQKCSFVGGISEGLCLAVLLAKEAGCNLAHCRPLKEFADYLGDLKCPPVRSRNKAAQKPKPARQQLWDDMKELVRRAIAGRMRVPKSTYDTSLDAWEEADKQLLTAIAIAQRDALDDAIADIQILRSIAGGGDVDRESVRAEVEACYEKFAVEIASIERCNELSKRKAFKVKDIWSWLRARTPLVNLAYDDDELREMDARYADAR